MSDLLLLSGGVDSIALAAWFRPALCLTIDYGQVPASAEAKSSAEVCQALSLSHRIVTVPMDGIGSGLLAGGPQVTASKNAEFWPFRNQILLTLGGMIAISEGLKRVLIGTVNSDCRHDDGKPEFVALMGSVMRLQEGHIDVVAPALKMSSGQLIERSGVQASVLAWAHSCHTSNLACGACPGCYKHSEVMAELGWER